MPVGCLDLELPPIAEQLGAHDAGRGQHLDGGLPHRARQRCCVRSPSSARRSRARAAPARPRRSAPRRNVRAPRRGACGSASPRAPCRPRRRASGTCARCRSPAPSCARRSSAAPARRAQRPRSRRCAARASASASASEAPTSPPPTIAIAQSAARVAHAITRSISADRPRQTVRQQLVTVRGDGHVVLDAHADVPPAARHALRPGRDVDAGLDGQAHAGLEHAPLVADLVVADVVHVHAEPVTGAMHVEVPVGAVLDELRQRGP